MTDEAKALVDHIRSDLTYITGLADHMEAGGDVSKKNIGDLIAIVRWNAEHHLECRDTIETQAREIERLNTILSEMNDTDVIARTMAENERLREALTAVYNEGDFASVRIATLALGAAYD